MYYFFKDVANFRATETKDMGGKTMPSNIWSIEFWVLTLVVGAIWLRVIIRIWLRYGRGLGEVSPSWTVPAIESITIVGAFLVVATLGWNFMVSMTTAASQEQTKVMESQLPDK